MFATPAVPRVRVIPALVVALLGLGLTAAPATSEPSPAAAEQSSAAARTFAISTLNLKNNMPRAAIRHDVRKVIRAGASVIGMQERRGTKGAVRAALPKTWRLYMPTSPKGADDNPIAWNDKVWKVERTWPRILAKKTWHRDGIGHQAITQFATVVVLKHRSSGHTIRAASFHMPSEIHNRGNGGPNMGQRDRVQAFWRMATNVRRLANATPASQQFVAMCDCNVTESKDRGKQLVRGKITRPLKLENNYSAAGYRSGWRIDYVMAERRKAFKITNWRVLHNLRTDHPGVVTRFHKR